MERLGQVALLAALMVLGAWTLAQFTNASRRQARDAVATQTNGTLENGVLYAQVRVQPAPAPLGMYERPLPRNADELFEFHPPRHPPRRYFERKLCAGDATELARFEAVLADDPLLVDMYGDSIDRCEDAGVCAVAHDWLDGGVRSAARTALMSRLLGTCEPEALAAVIDDPQISLIARARYRRLHADRDHADPILVEGFEREVADHRFFFIEVELASALSLSSGDEAMLERVERLVPDGGPFVARLVHQIDRHDDDGIAATPATRDELLDQLLEGRLWPMWLVADGGTSDAERAALLECARTTSKQQMECLRAVAQVDWSLAKSLVHSHPAPRFTSFASAVRRFDSQQEFDAIGVDTSGRRLLEASRDGHSASHLSAIELFAALSPVFDEAVFLVSKPVTGDQTEALTIWLDDKRYDVSMAPGCNPSDPQLVVGTLNSVMRDTGALERYYPIELIGHHRPRLLVTRPDDFARFVDAGVVRVVAAGELAAHPDEELD